jgi:hypothetical protein
MRKIWLLKVKGLMFKLKKTIYVSKFKMYVCWSNVFALPRLFVKLQISHP